MPVYRVFLNGRNFVLRADNRAQRLGFYTFRVVDASGPEDAERIAVEMIRRDPKLKGILNDKTDPPVIDVEEISEAEPASACKPVPGYSFYPEESTVDGSDTPTC